MPSRLVHPQLKSFLISPSVQAEIRVQYPAPANANEAIAVGNSRRCSVLASHETRSSIYVR